VVKKIDGNNFGAAKMKYTRKGIAEYRIFAEYQLPGSFFEFVYRQCWCSFVTLTTREHWNVGYFQPILSFHVDLNPSKSSGYYMYHLL
jgi:hypothetical protein